MNYVLSAIFILLVMDSIVCEPGIFSSYMGVDYQDGGFGKYIFMETKSRRRPPRRMKKPRYMCRKSGIFPDPIDPGSFYTCTFSFSDGYTYTRYFCPPFYTYSEEKRSCVIYYDEFPNGGNETATENQSNDNITDITDLPSIGELSTISLTPI